MTDSFAIINKTRGNPPIDGLPLLAIKEAVLGKDYELELVFVNPKESQIINRDYHKKDGPTNILSFPLEKISPLDKARGRGQIFICPSFAKKEAPKFGRNFKNYIAFLFIHGVVHLKGFAHGSKMDSEEEKFRSLFSV